MKHFILFLFFSATLFLTSHGQTQRYSLNSSNPTVKWEVKPQAEVKASGQEIAKAGFQFDKAVTAEVPGVVFSSYVQQGLIPDPNFGDNIYKVDETYFNRPFWYRTQFNLPSSYRKGQKVWLHFDNTNRYADFYLNGKKLSGDANSTRDVSGHMLRSKYEVSELLNAEGPNVIAVLITDPDQTKTRKATDRFGVTASPTYLSAASWDWMPYVPGRLAGITGDVYLRLVGDVVMEDPWVRSELESNDIAYLYVSSDLKNESNSAKEVEFSGVFQPGNIQFSKKVVLQPKATQKVYIAKNEFKDLIVHKPKLWWPNGYGEPNLYDLQLQVKIDGQVSDTKDIRFGIRKYEYQYSRNKVGWPVLNFFINGQKIYLKGGNWGMSEYLLRARGEDYKTRIKLHQDMNYNMIRLWTGTVTDDEFYDYCDEYGIMVWDDFWLYVAYNDVASDADFKANALDKVKRLRNHASIAIWCGANETHPKPELDSYLRSIVASEDHNDRLYKSSSNQDGLSGSGWWGNQPPKHHFETSGSNLAWNEPPYPYGPDYGYGLRTEIGTTTFPNYESIVKFMPADKLWPLPTDQQLLEEDDNVWNRHYFGKEASNASPVNYKKAVNTQYGESNSLPEFTEKAQYINLEVMKGMYEAWNDKMWNDASGMLIWMSQSAFPSFVWQTYDYYYDATGAYWGAKQASEPLHIQWNASSNSIKAINTTSQDLKNAIVEAKIYDSKGRELPAYGKKATVQVEASNIREAFHLDFNPYNLAKGKKVFSSSTINERHAALVTDGALGSRWESDFSDEEWIYVDLEKVQDISAVLINWEAAHATAYTVESSLDAKSWKTIKKVSAGKGGVEEWDVQGVKARYIRISCTKRATLFGYSIFELEVYGKQKQDKNLTALHFIKLSLKDSLGNVLSENTYWRNGQDDLNYQDLNKLPAADLHFTTLPNTADGKRVISVKNNGKTVAFGNRLRLVNATTGERVLPAFFSANYFTLMPGEQKDITIEFLEEHAGQGMELLWKQYQQQEKKVL